MTRGAAELFQIVSYKNSNPFSYVRGLEMIVDNSYFDIKVREAAKKLLDNFLGASKLAAEV